MKIFPAIVMMLVVGACNVKTDVKRNSAVRGTWKLLSGTLIEKNDTTTTLYSDSLAMIKIINDSHFSFLNHDTKQGKGSSPLFVAGGGRYDLEGDNYTEHLEYCSDRQWEGHDFNFKVVVKGDTLTQTGREKIEDLGIDRINIERYVRINN
jgi:hypothetical protein